MPTVPLPDEPNLEQLRKQAKDLRRAYQVGQPDAVALAAEHYPAARQDEPGAAGLSLAKAQLVVARKYGFASWDRLRRHVEMRTHYSRYPDRVGAAASVAEEFLRLACLTYGHDDGPERRAAAARLLADNPDVASSSIFAAAVVADQEQVSRFLAADPGIAGRDGGPFGWQPLFYLAYARHDPSIRADAVLDAARLLLSAGADPNAGYLWHGLPTPFTVLTGTFGEGELGPVRQPRHPHSLALARVLLEAGADPNDGQALYNRMFEPGNDHLELLFEFGLGSGDGGPWRARLGEAAGSPAELVQGELDWAVTHDLRTRVRLLIAHGADIRSPFSDGATPAQRSAVSGHREMVDLLVAHGAQAPDLEPADAFVAAVLDADRAAIERLRLARPGLIDDLRRTRPGLPVWAAVNGRSGALVLLSDLGFDLSARGRGDVPVEQAWETALHRAAEKGDTELIRLLLDLGADPNVRDTRFDGTPLGWARHFGQQGAVDLLLPVTNGEPDEQRPEPG
jgi:ankyrin repeat protein